MENVPATGFFSTAFIQPENVAVSITKVIDSTVKKTEGLINNPVPNS